MHKGEMTRIIYIDPEIPNPFQSKISFMQSNVTAVHLNRFQGSLTSSQPVSSVYEYSMCPSSLSSNTTSDEADVQQIQVVNERKQKRMISNRESAHRSRVRKRRHLDELCSQVWWLRNENHNLTDKLSRVSECHNRVLQENARLKRETSDLHQVLCSLQLLNPYSEQRSTPELSSTTDHLIFESLNESIGNRVDLLD